MLEQVGVKATTFTIPDVWTANTLEPGQQIGTPALLFSQIPTARAEVSGRSIDLFAEQRILIVDLRNGVRRSAVTN